MNNLEEIEYNNDYKILKNQIQKFIDIPENKKYKLLIKKELEQKEKKFNHPKEYYRNQIYFSKKSDCLEYLDLQIVFCNDNRDLSELWNYFKIMTSSAFTGEQTFGSIKYMIKDKNTNTYLGIVQLSNDIYSCAPRDDYIGWNPQLKKKKVKIINNLEKSLISFITNITCCIGLQPMSYNLNIGKLLVASVFSQEVQDYFYNLRGYKCSCITTFGLYGKSVQYERMNEIKYIGETKGSGTCFLPNDLYNELVNFMKKYHNDLYKKTSHMTSPKMRIIQYGMNLLDINQSDILFHGYKRGIYIGYTSHQSNDFLNGKIDSFEYNEKVKPFQTIFKWWKERWSVNRLKNMIMNNKFKIKFELKDFNSNEKKNQYDKQYQFIKMSDTEYLKQKQKKSREYYYEHKDELLKETEIQINNHNKNNYYISDEYLGGFFDADGSIYFSNNVININFTQCVLNVLISIQEKYEGQIYKKNKTNETSRDTYSLVLHGIKIKDILVTLNKTSILKATKIKYALDYIKFINKPMSNEKQNLINLIKYNHKEDNNIYFSRLNIKYITGFFDGDGSVYLNYRALENNKFKIKCTFVQKYTPQFLVYLKNYLKDKLTIHIGIADDRIYFESINAIEKFYELIKNELIVKKYQFTKMNELITLYRINGSKITQEIKQIAYDIRYNKHEQINYDIDFEKLNMIETLKCNIKLKNEKIEESQYNNEKTIEIQKFKKTGLNNPNYGKKMNDEHVCKISIESSKTKRAKNPNLTNEKIHEIYKLKDKIMQKDVAEKYNMNREMIRRIWNRELLPTDDPEFETNVLNKKTTKNIDHSTSTSLGKRSLTTPQYIEILLWKIKKNNNELLNGKKINSPKLSEELTYKMKTKISNDIIKNIWNGRTKLFEYEFNNQKITYEDYLKIINP